MFGDCRARSRRVKRKFNDSFDLKHASSRWCIFLSEHFCPCQQCVAPKLLKYLAKIFDLIMETLILCFRCMPKSFASLQQCCLCWKDSELCVHCKRAQTAKFRPTNEFLYDSKMSISDGLLGPTSDRHSTMICSWAQKEIAFWKKMYGMLLNKMDKGRKESIPIQQGQFLSERALYNIYHKTITLANWEHRISLYIFKKMVSIWKCWGLPLNKRYPFGSVLHR